MINDYLKTVEPAKRKALQRIRTLAKEVVPEAEEAIVYGMPALKFLGKPFLGFDAHKNHIGIYPFSGRVFETIADQLHGYKRTKGALHVPLDKPIPKSVLQTIIGARLRAIRSAAKA